MLYICAASTFLSNYHNDYNSSKRRLTEIYDIAVRYVDVDTLFISIVKSFW